MDNCDLEKLSVEGAQLNPPFKPEITFYTVTLPSNISKVTLTLLTCDCGASYKILSGDGSKTLHLHEGLNQVDIEVTAEDGTIKKYSIELTKLSASEAKLNNLIIQNLQQLHPEFSPYVYEYSGTVNFDCHMVKVETQVPDHNMQVTVNEDCSSNSVFLHVGDTMVTINVLSPDGTKSQVYTVMITREQILLAVTFCDVKDQMEFECPASLNALYRPVSINGSDPKVIFSAPYIDMLTRRSKVNPFTEGPLGDSWKVPEIELDKKMSNMSVKCFFAYRGCESVLKLAEVLIHAKECAYKPQKDLHTKEVTETNWYKKYFASSDRLEIETKHCLQVRNWEKRLQTAVSDNNVDDLCCHAQSHIHLFKERLPKPGDIIQNEEKQSPLHCLEQAAINYATAIKFKPRDPNLHLLLGKTLEEYYYAAEMYGLKKKSEEDEQDLDEAKATGRQEEILAICKLHGFLGTPTIENQLKALDKEFHQLKDHGQSAKADYIQTLFIWLSKKFGKSSKAGVSDEESWLHRAFLKYLDAWSLSPDCWELNLQVGRLLLLQEKSREALQHLRTALALRPSHAALRFYTGLALLQQDGASEEDEQEATLFLQQGLESVMGQCLISKDQDREQNQDARYSLSTVNAQFLRGCLSLGALLSKRLTSGQMMSPVQVYHMVAVLAMRAVSQCTGQGEVTQQLEWVLLHAHFALLEALLQQQNVIQQAWTAKRCQALSALIRLSCIPPCRELLDMQQKVCELGVITTPRSSTALCLLGLAQFAQYDKDPNTEKSQAALADACLSFQASITLEGHPLSGNPLEQLIKQKWWQDHLAKEKEKMDKQHSVQSTGVSEVKVSGRGRGAPARGRAAPPVKSSASVPACRIKNIPGAKQTGQAARGVACRCDGGGKSPVKSSNKLQLSPCKSRQECNRLNPLQTKPAVVEEVRELESKTSQTSTPDALNVKSPAPRLGLARALSRSPDNHQQACTLYQEVITMAPEIHDAYIELANLLVNSDPLAAVDVYSRFPLKPVSEQTFDDAFITGEIVRILMKQELYDHPKLATNLIAYGKVMGLSCLEKYIEILDGKFMTNLLKNVYAGIHDKSVDDVDLQEFFRFKCWI